MTGDGKRRGTLPNGVREGPGEAGGLSPGWSEAPRMYLADSSWIGGRWTLRARTSDVASEHFWVQIPGAHPLTMGPRGKLQSLSEFRVRSGIGTIIMWSSRVATASHRVRSAGKRNGRNPRGWQDDRKMERALSAAAERGRSLIGRPPLLVSLGWALMRALTSQPTARPPCKENTRFLRGSRPLLGWEQMSSLPARA